ncbi:CRISPR-associated protein Cas4 [Candidatus Oscillochloris fontis]|uniref:CRISPR-associated protein Cas4 n=1 Tax=Candidatus Oscillochloris fontis TaxID=2496868 RepID=UPI00101DDBB1|nr:CRISPR-associated protein Cas4 [Candidatus Oscillochloris fontis]
MTTLAIALIVLAVAMLILALRTRAATGIPWAPILSDDAQIGHSPARTLVSRRYHLSGKPDYIIERHGRQIPIEVKPSRTARQPYHSDLMQLAAYCLLIEETTGQAPPYGILRYAEQSFQLRYTPSVRNELLSILDEMQTALEAEDVERNHDQPQRCAHCGLRHMCDDALV